MNVFQAPPLPRYYVDRPEYSDNLKANLLTNSPDTQAIVVTAIHGLGAVGKSTLATALAYDEEVQSRFADGILWVTLGQEPNILPMLSVWVQALGDYNFKPTSVEATANHLRTLLFDKAVLLVVDDAWSPDHAQIFNLGGPRCQVLVTTREKAIADVLDAEIYNLDVMTLSQSMQLLSQRLGREIRGEEAKQAEALVKELGYLPLALELAAAQVADGMSWGELLVDIQGEIARLKTLDILGPEDVVDEASLKKLSLTASLNLSIKQLKHKRREDFIWLGILPDDVNITPGMAAVLWGMNDERDARDKLKDLRRKALLLDGVALADGKPTYRLHDLFHDLARNLLTAPLHPTEEGDLPGLGIRLAKAHKIFLKKYRKLTDNHLWHTLPNDGYIHQHLVWHLEKAGKIEEIHGLLAEESQSGANGWYETCERLGQMGIFITDVARAWELAEIDWDEGRLPQVVGWQCRYALITASINSLAANLPGNLLVALVKHNFWTPEQGLAYVLQKPEPRDKGDSIKKLVDYLPDNLKKLALSEALATTRQIQNEVYRAEVLCSLVDKLPELLPEALAAAQQIQSEGYRAEVLSALADKLPELLPEALAAAQQIQSERYRARVLSALADKLTPELLPEALAAAQQIQSGYRAEVLSALADKLPEILPEALATARQISDEIPRAEVLSALADKLPEILPEALAATRQISDEISRAGVLNALADKLTPELLPEALDITRQIRDDRFHVSALRSLANKLTPELLPEALDITRKIEYEGDRAQVFRALVDKFPELLREALATARQIRDKIYRAEVLSALADKFPEILPEILPEALAVARKIEYEKYRAEVLSALSDKFPEILPEALAVARKIEYEKYRVKVIGVLADKLTPEILPEALAVARKIEYERYRAEVLSALADKFPEILPEALTAAQQIPNEVHRAEVLSALADKFPEILPEALAAARQIQSEVHRAKFIGVLAGKFPELLPEALTVAQQIQDEKCRTQLLSALADKLTPELLPEAMTAAQQIQSEKYRAEVLSSLAGKLPELLPEILATARKLQSEYDRAPLLVALAGKLTPELLPEALAAARQIHFEISRAEVFRALADKFPELLPEALAAVRQIQSEGYRAPMLSALGDKFPEILPEALATARQIQDEYHRPKVLSALANKLSQMQKTQLYTLWQNTLHTLSLRTRPDLLSDITALTTVIFSLGGEEAIKNIVIAIQDVSRWWR
ncbi:hypothetical protein D4Z78_26660 [Okeania hirsuta]|nr:hypothetical protein D4Z78_26660 [Okeania hirsuta]